MKLDDDSSAEHTQSLNSEVHRAFRTEPACSSGCLNLGSCTVHGFPLTPVQGFVVLDAKREFIAWAACPIVAKNRCDGDPLAHSVERCSDGELMAWKYRRGKHRP